VFGQQCLERLQLSFLCRCEEAVGEGVALLGGRLEPWTALVDVSPRPGRQLAGVVLSLPDDLSNLALAIVEDLMQQEDRSLLGREALARTRAERSASMASLVATVAA
jgi:hypothetical protein